MIRQATDADVAALVRLVAEVHQLHLAGAPDRYRDASAAELEVAIRALIAAADRTVLVADVAGDLVGHVVVRRVETAGHTYAPPRLTAYVEQLGVRADARRGGHGRALMAAAEAAARAWGVAAITLDVQAFNDDARCFYRALGYDVTTWRLARSLASADDDAT